MEDDLIQQLVREAFQGGLHAPSRDRMGAQLHMTGKSPAGMESGESVAEWAALKKLRCSERAARSKCRFPTCASPLGSLSAFSQRGASDNYNNASSQLFKKI